MSSLAQHSSDADLAGQVLTVRGPVAPDQLGVTLMHEHLFLDIRKAHLLHLRNLGVTEAQIDKMMVHNPAAILPFVVSRG